MSGWVTRHGTKRARQAESLADRPCNAHGCCHALPRIPPRIPSSANCWRSVRHPGILWEIHNSAACDADPCTRYALWSSS